MFERENSDWALGVRTPEPGYRMDSVTIADYVRWYADVLRGTTNLLPAMVAAAA